MTNRWIFSILLFGLLAWIAPTRLEAQVLAQAQAQTQTAGAGNPTLISDRAACNVEKATFRQVMYRFPQVHLVQGGLVLQVSKNKQQSVRYDDIAKISVSPGFLMHADFYLRTKEKKTYHLVYAPGPASNDALDLLQAAVTMLANDTLRGKSFTCSEDPQDYAAALADFQQKTAAWVASATKPPISDEVYKDRLLAEDALKNRNLKAAVDYYELGVQSDPTWAQGWYDAAVAYSELTDYADAADCMQHYVVLMPNAPDVQKAKDNVILWAAKADQASGAPLSSTSLK